MGTVERRCGAMKKGGRIDRALSPVGVKAMDA